MKHTATLLLIGVAWLLLGCHAETPLPTPPPARIVRPGADVILLTVDALRADRLSADYKRDAAPTMRALYDKSVVFERTYTPMPHTSYAISSLLTGKRTHPLFEVPSAPQMHETWPDILRGFRYHTAAFFTKAIFFVDRQRFAAYQKRCYGFERCTADYNVTAQERVAQLVAYIDEMTSKPTAARRPFFAWAHFFEPHEPYEPSCTRFGPSAEERYDCEVRAVDDAIGALVAHLDEVAPQTLLILTADHGEEFGEHGGQFHGTTLFDEQVRVPLAIRIPQQPHSVIQTPASLVDVLGTVLSTLDLPIPPRVRSRDLFASLEGGRIAEATYAEREGAVMLVAEDHKLIYERETGKTALYDLRADPGEAHDVAAAHPELCRRLTAALQSFELDDVQHELRPVAHDQGEEAWDPLVQRALAGDDRAVDALPRVVASSLAPLQRRTAALLLRRLWGQRPLEPITQLDDRGDDIVEAWLSALLCERGAPVEHARLAELAKRLPALGPPWRELVLARIHIQDDSVLEDAVLLALQESAPSEQRKSAIDYLGLSGHREIARLLHPLVDDFSLTMKAAAALATLGDHSGVPVLIKRLKRERFAERKAAIIDALVVLGGKDAALAIADELDAPAPPPNARAALAQLRQRPLSSRR